MMKSDEYIRGVIDSIYQDRLKEPLVLQGAFFPAAQAIIEQVESPMKEEAFVRLATLTHPAGKEPSELESNVA